MVQELDAQPIVVTGQSKSAQARELARQGYTRKQIAETIDARPMLVYMATKGMEDEFPNLRSANSGGGGGGGGARVLVDMQDGKGARPRTEVIRELWVAGHTRSAIAKLFKCNPMTVYMATKGIAGGPTGQIGGRSQTTMIIDPNDVANMEAAVGADLIEDEDSDLEEHELGVGGGDGTSIFEEEDNGLEEEEPAHRGRGR